MQLFYHLFIFFIIKRVASQLFDWPPNAEIKDADAFDIIIVGAGSAGCVLANRLTEIKDLSVLLIEAGGDPPIYSIDPNLAGNLLGSKYLFNYLSEYDPRSSHAQKIAGRVSLRRGKLLGGCSGVNGMQYVRGNPEDYNSWARAGFNGWDWGTISPYFLKSEHFDDQFVIQNPIYARYHGTSGPMIVTQPKSNDTHIKRSMSIMRQALSQIGIPPLLDYNGPTQFGASPLSLTQSKPPLIRSSTAQSFILPIKNRKNLKVSKFTYATKILIDNTHRAFAVEVYKNSTKFTILAKKEIIVSTGSLNTPKLLIASGIGPVDCLQSLNINLVSDLPVGQSLQDHIMVPVLFTGSSNYNETDKDDSFSTPIKLNGFFSIKNFMRPDFQITTNFYSKKSPLIHIQFGNRTLNYNDQVLKTIIKANDDHEIMVAQIQLLHPHSSGKVVVKGVDVATNPKFHLNYLSEINDLETVKEGLKSIIKLKDTSYLKKVNASIVKLDIAECNHLNFKSDEYWECYIMNLAATGFHPSRTCPMGKVVDERFNVFGVEKLKVVDASVFPSMPSGNINAIVIMMAERAADIIKEDVKCF